MRLPVNRSKHSINVRRFCMARLIDVEVAYAEAEMQVIVEVKVSPGCTIEEAVIESGILRDFPGVNLEDSQVGIFGEKKSLHTIVNANDRIEIYRALLLSAKEARRERAGTKTKLPPNKPFSNKETAED